MKKVKLSIYLKPSSKKRLKALLRGAKYTTFFENYLEEYLDVRSEYGGRSERGNKALRGGDGRSRNATDLTTERSKAGTSKRTKGGTGII